MFGKNRKEEFEIKKAELLAKAKQGIIIGCACALTSAGLIFGFVAGSITTASLLRN